jgi:hypothetical protein
MILRSVVRVVVAALAIVGGTLVSLAQITPCAAVLGGDCPGTACDALQSGRTCIFLSQCTISSCMTPQCGLNIRLNSFQDVIRTKWVCTHSNGPQTFNTVCYGGINQPGSAEVDCCKCTLTPQ